MNNSQVPNIDNSQSAPDPNIPDFSSAHPATDVPDDATPETSCGAIIIHDNKILIVHQNNGLSGFPKGHVEPGETEVEAAFREVKEETGLDVFLDASTRYAFSYYIPRLGVIKTVILFLARPQNPSQIPKKQENEIVKLEWLPFDQIESTLNFPEWQKAWHAIRTKYLL